MNAAIYDQTLKGKISSYMIFIPPTFFHLHHRTRKIICPTNTFSARERTYTNIYQKLIFESNYKIGKKILLRFFRCEFLMKIFHLKLTHFVVILSLTLPWNWQLIKFSKHSLMRCLAHLRLDEKLPQLNYYSMSIKHFSKLFRQFF